MELIHTDASRRETGILRDYTLDLSLGAEDNTFELTLPRETNCLRPGCLIGCEGSDCGGIVDGLRTEYAAGTVTALGRSFTGILGSFILCPDPGQDYLEVSGSVGEVLTAVIERLGIGDLFAPEDLGETFSVSWRFPRYCDAYAGLTALAEAHGRKLKAVLRRGKIRLSLPKIRDLSESGELCGSLPDYALQQYGRKVNHLICLGRGELKDRLRADYYADSAGNISTAQSLFGLDEIAAVYDYPNAESEEELRSGGRERLRELMAVDAVSVSLPEGPERYDIGDRLRVTDDQTGISVTAAVTGKLLRAERGRITTKYEIGVKDYGI